MTKVVRAKASVLASESFKRCLFPVLPVVVVPRPEIVNYLLTVIAVGLRPHKLFESS